MSQIFDAYAAYYDLLYKTKDYAAEAEYVECLICEHAPNAKHILELGCGTGAHAEHFARMGYTVEGVDISQSMLGCAKKRCAGLPDELVQRLNFDQGDVRTYRKNKMFDVVLSLFHVFGYQISNQDLASIFKTAAAHLPTGGLLIFDYWYGPAVLTQCPSVRVKRLEDNQIKVLRIAEPAMYLNENRVQVDYTVQITEKTGGLMQEIHESHNMRYLFLPEIENIARPWFKVNKHFAWMKKELPGSEDWAGVSILERLS